LRVGLIISIQCYGAKTTPVLAELGNVPTDEQIIKALQSKPKMITITHVDTSTGVKTDAAHISSLVKKHSPETLIALDAVCAVASEEIRFDDWGLDLVISATQKGLGAPPGLSVIMASARAIKVRHEPRDRSNEQTYESRKTPVPGYYMSWKNWLPIMRAYEEGRAAYFATRA
jgi:alanine-glyoxylate transaminase/serine-glyoxylate transaminase/serine-pyruvate transaminase